MLLREGLQVPEVAALSTSLHIAAGPILLGMLDARPCYAIAVEEGAALDGGLMAVGLRELFAGIEDPALLSMASRASQTLDWWFGSRLLRPLRYRDRATRDRDGARMSFVRDPPLPTHQPGRDHAGPPW